MPSSSPCHRFLLPFHCREDSRPLAFISDHLNILYFKQSVPLNSCTWLTFSTFLSVTLIFPLSGNLILSSNSEARQPSIRNSFFRHISLPCWAVDVLEKLILRILNYFLSAEDTQLGFGLLRSSIHTFFRWLVRLPPEWTSQTAAMYCSICGELLCSLWHGFTPRPARITRRSNFPNNLVRWLSSYLHDRLGACLCNDSLSPFRLIHVGGP